VLPDQAAEIADAVSVAGPVVFGGDTNLPGYSFDLARGDGTILDPSAQAIFERGYDDLHAPLPVVARPTRSGVIIDLIFGRQVQGAAPTVCRVSDCAGLSDHQAVWVDVE
jgi:endonuclease/exonuclease/phosphatase (EEP) superfamily protein YafD